MGDFLGTGTQHPKDREYRPYHEARAFVRALGLSGKQEWQAWSRTEARPADIPTAADRVYKNDWKSWADFLGTRRVRGQFRSFEAAREFARAKGFNSNKEWRVWAKTADRPLDIPVSPEPAYADEWQGWGDFLGATNKWTLKALRAFVRSLLDHLPVLTDAERYLVFQQHGLTTSWKGRRDFVRALTSSRFPQEELEKFVAGDESLVDRYLSGEDLSLEGLEADAPSEKEDFGDFDLSEVEVEAAATDETDRHPVVRTAAVLDALDHPFVSSADEEAADFLIASGVAKIWKHAYADDREALADAQAARRSDYAEQVRTTFLEEYYAARAFQIPRGYSFQILGEDTEPNLMQRHVASQVATKRRFGNWSGTGAGKTLSAVLASRAIGARLTVVCCPNAVVGKKATRYAPGEGWVGTIENAFPNSEILTKALAPEWKTEGRPRYLVVNYEKFQQEDSEALVARLLAAESIDMIVVDEIHFAKQRNERTMSKRKRLVQALVCGAGSANEKLAVLGMSATPVINNLTEGRSMIELVTGLEHNDIQTRVTINNCMRLHQRLVTLGTRWMPDYDPQLLQTEVPVDCSGFLDEITSLGTGPKILELERILVKAKLPTILENLSGKTLIYVHYVHGIVELISEGVKAAGWRVGVYTGHDKTGLEGFLYGDVDVLIGSSAMGTGVDGLQNVCSKLIVACLPWTNAEFEQLRGRIYRQGQAAEHVSIVVPLTFAEVGGELGHWSWCDSRMSRIRWKKSVADAAVDGVVPEGHLRTPEQAYRDVMGWLKRLQEGDVQTVERHRIVLPLSDEAAAVARRGRRYGDFSRMNARWNNSNSRSLHERLANDPEEWQNYHTLYQKARESWEVVPYEELIKWCRARPGYVIGDFGCGEAKIAEALNQTHTVHSFDHVALDGTEVVVCDVGQRVPLEDGSLDVALFSLSLMGSNCADYLVEAHRCLRLDGHIHIVEATSRFSNLDDFCACMRRIGFDVANVEHKAQFTFIRGQKTERAPQQLDRLPLGIARSSDKR